MTSVDDRLTDLFARQADVVEPGAAPGIDTPYVGSSVAGRGRRIPIAAVAVAAAVALVAAAVLLRSDTNNQRRIAAGNDPGAPAAKDAFDLRTDHVAMSADSIAVTIGDRTFSPTSAVDVHSDPGEWDTYTTLEMIWTEAGSEMRLFAYFGGDHRDWWVDHLTTYDGTTPSKWVAYPTEVFGRHPLGTPFSGDVDVTGTPEPGGSPGHLTIRGLRLQPFLRPAACTNPTTATAIVPSESSVTIELPEPAADGVTGGYGVSATLMDTAPCGPAADQAVTFAWSIDDPSIASLRPDGNRVELTAHRRGTTTLRATARPGADGRTPTPAAVAVTVR